MSGASRFVYLSSAAAMRARGLYGKIKGRAEEAVEASGLPHGLPRPSLVYGPGDTKNVAHMVRTIRRLPIVFGLEVGALPAWAGS